MAGVGEAYPWGAHNDLTEQGRVAGAMVSRRWLILGGPAILLTAAILAACDSDPRAATPDTPQTDLPSVVVAPKSPEELFLRQAGEALIGLHEENSGGWRFKSEIQVPHYQTDRDVGAASVGMGFLALTEHYPNDRRWLDAAGQTANWLMAVGRKEAGGQISWADYVDDGGPSSSAYTSFDDGTIGIGDFFWRLYEKTGESGHKAAALGAVKWTLARAESVGQGEYRWRWDANDGDSYHSMGMGEGMAGIIHALATFYERTRATDPAFAEQCKHYIEGALRYLEGARTTLGRNGGDSRAIPETGVIGEDGDTAMNSGYLSGAAGGAFMYLKLYQVFGESHYLNEANRIFGWLQDSNNGPMVHAGDDAVAWKIMRDPQGGGSPALATGFEEGAAGIGWTYLQAYKLTDDQRYLSMAEQAANWLMQVAIRDNNGSLSWREYENPPSSIVHANLNNGAAGIGMFLRDLYLATNKQKYQDGATGALNWLMTTAIRDNSGLYWQDNDGESPYSRDPSWHWGHAGIVAFIARMNGGVMDIPGQQSGLHK